MNTINGIPIVASNLIRPFPAIQISDEFRYCSLEFREKMNTWLIEVFGMKTRAIMVGGVLYVDSNTMLKLKSEASKFMTMENSIYG